MLKITKEKKFKSKVSERVCRFFFWKPSTHVTLKKQQLRKENEFSGVTLRHHKQPKKWQKGRAHPG